MEKQREINEEVVVLTDDDLKFIDMGTISEEELLADYDPTEEERMMGEA